MHCTKDRTQDTKGPREEESSYKPWQTVCSVAQEDEEDGSLTIYGGHRYSVKKLVQELSFLGQTGHTVVEIWYQDGSWEFVTNGARNLQWKQKDNRASLYSSIINGSHIFCRSIIARF